MFKKTTAAILKLEHRLPIKNSTLSQLKSPFETLIRIIS